MDTNCIGIQAIESSLEYLDSLSGDLLDAVVEATGASLCERALVANAWRSSLFAGQKPAVDLSWPDEVLQRQVIDVVASLGLPRYCKGNEVLAEAVVRSMFKAVAEGARVSSQAASEELRRLEALERRRLEELVSREARTGEAPAEMEPLSRKVLDELADRAGKVGAERGMEAAARSVAAQWEARVRLWAAIEDVFGELGAQLGLGWDLSLGILHSVGWSELLRLQELVKRLDAIREVVRCLGRLRMASHGQDGAIETVVERMRRATTFFEEIPSPFVPAETRGVTRSDEISRMLPSEAALLIHPTLRLLWHARRAERSLCTYLVEGVLTNQVAGEGEVEVRSERRKPRDERGPIIACIDTSGSMHGLPETVAKAVVLECMRIAHAERRECYLYAFSGPGQVVEHALSLDPGGLGHLLEFLGQSFSGGTDVAEPIRRATRRIEADVWQKADLLLATDGEFPVDDVTIAAIGAARKKHGLRVQGVLIGNVRSPALDALCDDVARFRDWAAVLEG